LQEAKALMEALTDYPVAKRARRKKTETRA
jgi:hypothetical protein